MSEKINPSQEPAGYKRAEAKAIVKDQLEQRVEEENAAVGMEAVDQAKLDHRDNEIIRHLIPRGPKRGQVAIENAQPGYRYAMFTVADGYGSQAQRDISEMHTKGADFGYQPVQGDSPEAPNLKGQGRASGSTLRGVGDTVLMRIREDEAQQMDEYHAELQRRKGAVEEKSLMLAERYGVRTMHAVAGDFRSDPLMASVAGEAGRVESFRMRTDFSEGDLRRGSMQGPDGRILQPGFEMRGRR